MGFGDKVDTTPVEHTERFERVYRWIEDHGGEYQRTLEHFSEDVGLNTKALQRIIARMERYGCVLIIRSGHPTLGLGRFPNLYRLRMTWAEWLERRDGILEKDRKRKAAIARKNALKAAQVSAAKRKRGAELVRRENMTVGPEWKPRPRDLPWGPAPIPQGSTPPPARAFPAPNSPAVPGSAVERHAADESLDLDAWADADDF